MSATRSRYVIANGIRTHYTEAGEDGPVVVCLHGGGAGSSGDAGMGGLLPELAPNFRVLAVDGVGGFGLTDTNAPTPRRAEPCRSPRRRARCAEHRQVHH